MSIFGYFVVGVIALSLVGGTINAAHDTTPESETSFDIPDATVETVPYESPSGLYSIDFPIAVDGDTPAERAEPMVLTASTGSLPTNIVGTSAIGVANFEVQEATLPANRPPAAQLASERCDDNDPSAALTEIRVVGRPAWQCQWTVSNGFDADEVFLTVGDTALVLRGVTLPAAFDWLGYDNPFNAMVNSLQILRPD